MPQTPKSSSGSAKTRSTKDIGSLTSRPTYARIHAYRLDENKRTTRTVFGPMPDWQAAIKAKDLVEVGGYEMCIVSKEK